MATRKTDGSATTTVTTKEAEKTPVRGMTETHASMDAAKLHLANVGHEGGETRVAASGGCLGMVAKPDAFAELPKAPKPGK